MLIFLEEVAPARPTPKLLPKKSSVTGLKYQPTHSKHSKYRHTCQTKPIKKRKFLKSSHRKFSRYTSLEIRY